MKCHGLSDLITNALTGTKTHSLIKVDESLYLFLQLMKFLM